MYLSILNANDEEINRLRQVIRDAKETADELMIEKDKEIERLNSIIKEVREYIEELAEDTEDYIGAIDRRRKVELLEILDKVEENK